MTAGDLEFSTSAVIEGVKELKSSVLVPSLHHRKEGWVRHQENFA
jgi:hypothetical protein